MWLTGKQITKDISKSMSEYLSKQLRGQGQGYRKSKEQRRKLAINKAHLLLNSFNCCPSKTRCFIQCSKATASRWGRQTGSRTVLRSCSQICKMLFILFLGFYLFFFFGQIKNIYHFSSLYL